MPPTLHTLHTPFALAALLDLRHRVERVLHTVSTRLRRRRERLRSRQALRGTERALSTLDERMPRDLGLTRSQIMSTAIECSGASKRE
jgi:hypothetical protein